MRCVFYVAFSTSLNMNPEGSKVYVPVKVLFQTDFVIIGLAY